MGLYKNDTKTTLKIAAEMINVSAETFFIGDIWNKSALNLHIHVVSDIHNVILEKIKRFGLMPQEINFLGEYCT